MKYRTLIYSSGHELRDNGVGDYGLECPMNGYVGFAHMGQVMLFEQNAKCWACDMPVGNRSNPDVAAYALQDLAASS